MCDVAVVIDTGTQLHGERNIHHGLHSRDDLLKLPRATHQGTALSLATQTVAMSHIVFCMLKNALTYDGLTEHDTNKGFMSLCMM